MCGCWKRQPNWGPRRNSHGYRCTRSPSGRGVAIGTLYRYFPSKTHLFVAVMVEQIDQIGASFVRHQVQSDNPQDAVYEVLVRATRGLLRRPALSTAMLQSSSTANVATVPDVGEDRSRLPADHSRCGRDREPYRGRQHRVASADAAVVRGHPIVPQRSNLHPRCGVRHPQGMRPASGESLTALT